MNLTELLDRFPPHERELWELDRILVPASSDSAEGPFFIDLRASYPPSSLRMGAGSRTLGRKVPVIDALVGMDAYLQGVEVVGLDAWGAGLRNADLEQLLATSWFSGVRDLNLGSNALTSKGIKALLKHPVAATLQKLTLSYNRVGAALSKASLPALERLDLVYAGLNDKALVKLGTTELPKLATLILHGAARYTTVGKLLDANRMGDALPETAYGAEALTAFATSALGKQITALGLGSLTLDEERARVVGAHFQQLRALDLTDASMTADAVEALVSGPGLGHLERLVLTRTFAPRYSPLGEKNEPDARTATAMAALGRSPMARSLRELVLDQITLGEACAKALFSGEFPSLRRLDLRSCALGDAGLAALAQMDLPLETLHVDNNGIGPAGIEALLHSPWAGKLVTLGIGSNPIGDRGGQALAKATSSTSLTRLYCENAGLTDRSAVALAQGLGARLEVLVLRANRLSDEGAKALATLGDAPLKELDLAQNGLTPAGVELLQRELPQVVLELHEQDPSCLPPRFHGDTLMQWEEVQGVHKPRPAPPPTPIREAHPYPTWVERDAEHPDWVYAMPYGDEGYTIQVVHADGEPVITSDPPLVNRMPIVGISNDERWMAVRAYRDGVYVMDLESGHTERLGDTLTHKKGGACFCGGRAVFLDCDTEGDWSGRLDVYGRDERGTWSREHRFEGIQDMRDDLISLAGHRIFAASGRRGLFLGAVRGDQFRLLGWMETDRHTIFGVDDRVFLRLDRYTYELTNVDEVLDAAFARGTSPERLALG